MKSDDDNSDLILHRTVFENDIHKVAKLLHNKLNPSIQDIHGNTPLHLALMLGRKDCIHILLNHNCSLRAKNVKGWTPLAEAISYGNRAIIMSVLRAMKKESRRLHEERKPKLISDLKRIRDFKMELKWSFQCWIPLVSRLLPSDVCTLYKRGSCIRLDSTLVDFNENKWERGNISFIFRGSKPPEKSLCILDNKKKVYQYIRYVESDSELEEECDVLMSSDVVSASISAKNILFARQRSGWFTQTNKTTMIGPYKADLYSADGVHFITKKRREHLKEEDILRNKQIVTNMAQGQIIDSAADQSKRLSIAPPDMSKVTWDEYISARPPGEHPPLGRSQQIKCGKKSFRATLAMCQTFPLTIESLLDVLEILSPSVKHIIKLRKFLMEKLPPGFPIHAEIPFFPTISAIITFSDFSYCAASPSSASSKSTYSGKYYLLYLLPH